jgi:hypothetical protein
MKFYVKGVIKQEQMKLAYPSPKECIWSLTFGVIKFQSTT